MPFVFHRTVAYPPALTVVSPTLRAGLLGMPGVLLATTQLAAGMWPSSWEGTPSNFGGSMHWSDGQL